MIEYIDEDIELWHFNAWKSSIRAIFEDVCYTQRKKLIILDDIIRLKHSFVIVNIFDCERITFIDKDHRRNAIILDEIVLILQIIANINHVWIHSYRSKIDQLESRELFLFENIELETRLNNIDRQLFINLNRGYNKKKDENARNFFNDTWYNKRILYDEKIRSLRHIHQTRDELKIEYFDKEYVVEVFNQFYVFFFYFLFVDDFEIHRNMYRFFKAFYLILICLFYKKRRKIINVFILILNFYDVDMKNVVEAIRRFI